jgi:YbbR domain-containing protein
MILLRLIFRNFFYKIVAVVLAVVFWAATQGFRAIDATVTVGVVLEDLPPELVVVSQSARQIRVSIRGSRWAVRRADRQVDPYSISLAKVDAGRLEHGVSPAELALPRGAEILSYSPDVVVLDMDEVAEKSVRVNVPTTGRRPAGFQGVEAEPTLVRIAGAKSVLEQVQYISTETIDVSNLRESSTRDVPLQIERPNIWLPEDTPATVRIRVRIGPLAPLAPPEGVVPVPGA